MKKSPSACESMKTSTDATFMTTCLSKGDCCQAAPASSTLYTYRHLFGPTIPSHLSFSPVWNLNLPQLLLWLLYVAWPIKLKVVNSTLMIKHAPGRRKTQISESDFSDLLVDNCQFKCSYSYSLLTTSQQPFPDYMLAWIIPSQRYPAAADTNTSIDAEFSWKRNLYY